MKKLGLSLFTLFGMVACATVPSTETKTGCQFAKVEFKADFEGARLNGCELLDDGTYQLTILPENTPINDSAWYAFDVIGAKDAQLKLALTYQDGKHRYPPKIKDDRDWRVLDTVVDSNKSKSRAVFSFVPTNETVRIAGQAVFDTGVHKAWIDKMSRLSFVTSAKIGSSTENRPIYKLEETDAPGTSKPYVAIVGRQHPPETTGAESLMPFVETMWGDTALARKFRSEFNLVVIPLMNPDGVARGNWRHNSNGIDLNRDWGPFTQAETKVVKQELDRFRVGGDEIVVFLDFHSTWRNLIYTQTDAESKSNYFTRDWIANVKGRLPDDIYKFTREERPMSGRPISKNYMYNLHNIPSMTFEVGDNTPTQNIDIASKIFAEELMELLLERAG